MTPKPYEAVNGIYGRALAGELTALGEVVDVLARERIRTRQDDGTLRQINLSVPTVRRDVIVVGLRYEKRDGSHTEDHFVFDCAPPTKIDTRYGKKLEELFKEYQGAHKQRADFNSIPNVGLTSPNTITLNMSTSP